LPQLSSGPLGRKNIVLLIESYFNKSIGGDKMKNVYASLLMLLALAAGSNAQTLQSYTAVKDTTPNNLPKGSVWFVSEDSGSVWIAGDSALVAKADTSDLSTWSLLNSGIPSSVEINWLEFVNTSIIFAAGGNGAIYKTTDGGNSWNVVYYNAALTNFIDRITFFNATHGFAWGDGISSTSIQACLETTNGGSTWTNNNSQLIEYASSQIIRFVPPSNVFLTGGYDITFNKWGIWRSTDAGHNWSFASIGTSAKDSVTPTRSSDFKNNLVGVACRDDSTFWSTSDGGVTWQQIGSKAQTRFGYVQFVNGTNTVMAAGVGQASIAAIDLDASNITVYRDATKSTSFNWVNFPTLTRGYMSNGIQKTFYSVKSSTPSTGVDQHGSAQIPHVSSLSQNYPNPFNPSTAISYQIASFGMVSLRVYDLLGREIATLVNEAKTSGSYTATFNATNIPSGVYFYRLQSGSFAQTKRLVLIK
jgi:photosystem II stability/assembly factor-like uncharacterized protein